MYAITAKNVQKKYTNGNSYNILFEDLSLFVQEGEIVFISGQLGSGRTTLLKMIAAMTPPNHGTIEVFGENLLTIEHRSDWRLKHIGFLTNEDCLLPYLTVKQHLLMGQTENGIDTNHIHSEAEYILAMLDITEHKLLLYPEQLTKIDRLKITAARVLMTNPRLLLVDEFTKDVVEDDRYDLYKLLVEFARAHNTTLVITDEQDYCYSFDRKLKLENGKLNENTDQEVNLLH